MNKTQPRSIWQSPNFVSFFVCALISLGPAVVAMFNLVAVAREPFVWVPFVFVITSIGLAPVLAVVAMLAAVCGLLYLAKPAWAAIAARIFVVAAFLTMALITVPHILAQGIDFSNR